MNGGKLTNIATTVAALFLILEKVAPPIDPETGLVPPAFEPFTQALMAQLVRDGIQIPAELQNIKDKVSSLYQGLKNWHIISKVASSPRHSKIRKTRFKDNY